METVSVVRCGQCRYRRICLIVGGQYGTDMRWYCAEGKEGEAVDSWDEETD